MPTDTHELDRRGFLKGVVAGAGALSLGAPLVGQEAEPDPSPRIAVAKEYRGPNVIIVRFGGGVRRRETIEAKKTYSPFLVHDFFKRGTLFPQMEIASEPGIETSHGQGTLNILTGRYKGYKDVNTEFLGERFESQYPTLFEYLRKSFGILEHQTLIVNGEDRIDEEFYTFSNHHLFGVDYRSNVLSLYRFKVFLLRQKIERGLREEDVSGKELAAMKKELTEMETLDPRVSQHAAQAAELSAFWSDWQQYYGDSGFKNPRGDRLLTELAVRAMRSLRPKLLMINYNDCDYVHWGFMSHYTRAIQIMDEGLRQLVAAVEAEEEYRDNTIFAVVPDCGRDTNRFTAVPCQHHFGSRSSHEIFALFFGPGVPRGGRVDRKVDQISVAATLGKLMNTATPLCDGPVLEEAIA